jgi:very-short-patch-repair endonuclease
MVIRSLQDELTSGEEVRKYVTGNIRSRRQLLGLLELAENGSHSELEIIALHKVMQRFGLAHLFRQQHVARVQGFSIAMDFAAVEFKLDFETDGSRYHSSPRARSRDNKRDLALRTAGWHVLRALYEQVVDHPEQVASAILSLLVERGWTGKPKTTQGRLLLASLSR